MIVVQYGLSNTVARRELKEFLPKISKQAQQMIKHFISKTVVHKVLTNHLFVIHSLTNLVLYRWSTVMK